MLRCQHLCIVEVYEDIDEEIDTLTTLIESDGYTYKDEYGTKYYEWKALNYPTNPYEVEDNTPDVEDTTESPAETPVENPSEESESPQPKQPEPEQPQPEQSKGDEDLERMIEETNEWYKRNPPPGVEPGTTFYDEG